MLAKLIGLLTRPPVPFVLGVVLAVVVLWFGGHLLQSAYGWPSTTWIVSLCLLVVVAAVAFVVLRSVRAGQKARAIENEIRNQGRAVAAGLPPGSRDEVDALQKRFDEALASLQTSKLGRAALYAMPWFVVIGPPGSGKTTAITESGLNFPAVKGPGQKRGIRGVGGTRNCDWWFTDQAILLDTAGRYTTQAEDHEEWLAFLGMLKKARKLKPINGALVAFSITDVLDADEDALERHAATIRQRIDELVKQLEVVFPVYLMLTKCDLLDGFVEFFQAMSKEERAQVWGTTFHRGADGEVHERFGGEFELLCRQVDLERMRLLVGDRPAQQQQKIYSLPLQLRAARRKLTEFVRLLTQPNPYSDASELRGVYLTSGTQEGAPIDLVLKKLSAAYGMETRVEAGPKATAGVEQKSYFLRDLFTKVMQADKDLARSSAKVQRQRELGRKVVVWGSAVAGVTFAVLSILGWWNSRALLDDFAAARREVVEIPKVRDGEPSAEAQKSLGRLRDRFTALRDAYGTMSLLGPRRGVVVGAMTDYAAGVRAAFLEPMARYVTEQLQAYVNATDKVEDYTRISQLLTAYEALDRGYVPSQALRDALEQQNLWRWSPAQLGKGVETVGTSEASKHLETYVTARAFETDVWLVGHRKDLLGEAKKRLASGAESQNAIRKILEADPQARNASEEDMQRLVREQLPAGTTEVSAAKIKAERKLAVMQSMAAIGLADASSLPKVLASLMDLDAPESTALKKFEENLKILRLAGAAPPPGLGRDATREAYAAALKEIASLRVVIDQLVRANVGSGFLLPDAIENRTEWSSAFSKKWLEVQQNVDKKMAEIEKLLGDTADAATERVSEPIQSSLRGMFASIAKAIAREGRNEMQAHWQKNVGTALATVAERFPCAGTATAESTPAEFGDLLRPNGALAAEMALLGRLRAIKEISTNVELSDEFEGFAARVAAIQAACFGTDAVTTPRLRFRIAKMNRDSITTNIVLTIAQGNEVSQNSGSMDRIRNQDRQWAAGQTGAQLLLDTVVELPNSQTLKLTVPESGSSASAWSFLRVIAAGTAEKVNADAKVTWSIGYKRSDLTESKTVCWIQFEPIGSGNPLHPNFFTIKPPAKIFRDDP